MGREVAEEWKGGRRRLMAAPVRTCGLLGKLHGIRLKIATCMSLRYFIRDSSGQLIGLVHGKE